MSVLQSPARPGRVLAVLVLPALLTWIDSTVLGVALERLADPVQGLGASPGQLQWAIGIYALLFATALFAAGALGDRCGHRTMMMIGLVVFGGSSAWAAWAGDPVALILARAAMGLGGALIMPTSMAILGSTFAPERRAGAIAIWSSAAGVGVAAGPVLGGLLLSHFWWGSVFLINLPLVAIALLGAALVLPNPRSVQRRRLDPLGLGLSTLGLLGLSYGLIEGGHAGGWSRWQVWASIAAGLVLIAAFLYSEAREHDPSFDPRLFRNRHFAAGNLALGALFLTITGQAFYQTFYLQGARGFSPLHAGLLTLPGATGVVLGSPLGARLAARFGIARVSGTALAAFTLCLVLNLTFTTDTSLLWFAIVGATAGLAIGAAVAPTTAGVVATLPMDRIGAGSAVSNAIRQVGSVLGVAVIGTLVSSTYQHRIASSLVGLPDEARESAEATRHFAAASGRPQLVPLANDAFIHAMHTAALVAAGFTLVGAVVLMVAFRPRRKSEAPVPVSVGAPGRS